jgi:hypothetical protein
VREIFGWSGKLDVEAAQASLRLKKVQGVGGATIGKQIDAIFDEEVWQAGVGEDDSRRKVEGMSTKMPVWKKKIWAEYLNS